MGRGEWSPQGLWQQDARRGLLDRIDLHLEVPAVPFQELSAAADGTSSLTRRQQVKQARAVQARRFGPDAWIMVRRHGT